MATSPNKYHLHVLLLAMSMISAFVVFSKDMSDEYNNVDENGLKQGYWIIKGYMQPTSGYPSNTTIEEGLYEDNRKEGLWKRYFANGHMRSEITYVSNRPYGSYAVYYENGQLEEKGTWHRNKNVDVFERYHENGKPQQKFFFADNGKRNGVQQYFHDNGQLELEINIVNGKESGKMTRYYPDGKIKETKVFKDGVMESKSIKTQSHTKFKSKQEPEAATTQKSMKLAEVQQKEATNSASNFRPNGYNTMYNKDHQVTQIGEFKNGRLWNGRWNRYNGDGILIRIEIYKNGKYIGTGIISEK